MVQMLSERKTFETADGTTLSYQEAGEGRPLVLVHGWSQSAEQFLYQFNAFSASHHVIAFDQRGHGLSSRPDYGYRISRLAMDLRELLVGLDLDDVAILGHSMGCSVIWCYLDLFGRGAAKEAHLGGPAALLDDQSRVGSAGSRGRRCALQSRRRRGPMQCARCR